MRKYLLPQSCFSQKEEKKRQKEHERKNIDIKILSIISHTTSPVKYFLTEKILNLEID